MFRRDYIERLIEQFAKSLGAIIKLRKAKRFEDAASAIAESAKGHLGLELDMLRTLPPETVRDLCSPAGVLDPGRCLVTAELFCELGMLECSRGNDPQAHRDWSKALFLYVEVLDTPDSGRIPDYGRFVARADEVIEALSPFELSATLRARLLCYLERVGHFAAAEDALFEMLEKGDAVEESGPAFYDRLLARPESVLRDGNLPRSEVEEGRKLFLAKLRDRDLPG